MGSEARYSGRYSSRSRSRSPFRKNFNERPYVKDEFSKSSRRDRSPERRLSSNPKNRVFVSNIPFECRWMELKDVFREKVGDVSFVELFEDDNGKFKGCGIVEFKDPTMAQKAVDLMHKHEIRGRGLNVKLDTGDGDRGRTTSRTSDRERGGRLGGGGGGGGEGFGNSAEFRNDPAFNTYGLNPEFLKSLGIYGPLNNKVFISNLDYKVTEKKLEEIFKIAGKLGKVELNVDNEGKSKGHGTAEYEHPLEAVQAISMFNGQRLYARIINVRMDKFGDDEALPSKLPSGLHGIGKGLGMKGQPMQFHKNSSGGGGGGGGGSSSNGTSFGFGMGMSGNVGGGGSGGGMSVGASNLGMLSTSNMCLTTGGGSMGMNTAMTGDRMMNTGNLGMGLGGSSMNISTPAVGMGMGGTTSMMSPVNVMGRSSLESMVRDNSFQLGASSSRGGFREPFERVPETFNSASLSDTVLIGNLPSSFSWQTVKDRFRDIGEIRFADLKGQGTAMIRFASVQDAQRAVDLMNGVRLDGRVIQVRMY